MKKIITSAFALLGFFMLYAQEELPKVVPVSPEAASLGKYGDLPVNLASGRINYSIPIFTIKEGDLELPIYLSYNHSGLITEEDPGLVGLGWTLHAGGMIVRQLRGKPDEGSLGYIAGNIGKDWVIPYNYNLWANLPVDEREAKEINLIDGADTGRLDTQPDKYIINAGGLSGNFFYNETGKDEEVIFTPHKNYKVIQNKDGYVITDDKGIIYTFSAKENTYSEPITNNEIGNPPMNYISGWGLTKIESPTSNNSINIEYNEGANYYKEGYSESKSILTSKFGNSSICANINNLVKRSQINTEILSKQQISKIHFSKGSVHFDIREVPNNSHSRSKNYLHSITIKNKANQIINSYEFVFDNLLSNFKLLKEIKKYEKNSVLQIPFYKLDYNGTPPLSIFYAEQDSWGYYNGKSNTNLMNGDRSVNFSTSSLGSLNKITYPTKGYTQIHYESNKVELLNNLFLASGQCYSTPVNSTEFLLANSAQNPNPADKTILIKTDQIIEVRLTSSTGGLGISDAEASIGASPSGINFKCDQYSPCNSQGSCVINVSSQSENGQNIDPDDNNTSYFEVKANTLLTLSASAFGANAFGSARIDVNYFDPDLITAENNYVEVGGIRVSSTTDCSSSEECVSKNYKYTLENGLSSGKILSSPIYSYTYNIKQVVNNNISSPSGSGSCTVKQYSSNSKVPLASFQGAPVLYERVEILTNDNEIEGKIVQYFTSEQNTMNSFPFPPRNTKDWKKGNLRKQEIFQNIDNQMSLIKKTENIYETNYPYPTGLQQRKHSIGEVAGRNFFVYDNYGLQMGNTNDYSERSYNNRPEFYHLKSTTTTDYLHGSQLSKTITNVYNDLTGYSKEKVITDSQGDILKSVNTYPTSGRLVTENRIATPLKVESFKNTTKLSEQYTVYRDFNGLYLPEKIQVSKGNQSLEDRLIYHDYDDKGNPIEVSKKDGTHIVYLWGYDETLPIAKIENASFALVQSAIATLNSNYNTLTEIQALSNSDNDRTIDVINSNGTITKQGNEGNLRETLRDLRSVLSNAMVTTYTYDPLVGVTSITDPRGNTVYYEYDEFNRLKEVKDKDGNILSENQYNYKN